jgi:hypothetical protein
MKPRRSVTYSMFAAGIGLVVLAAAFVPRRHHDVRPNLPPPPPAPPAVATLPPVPQVEEPPPAPKEPPLVEVVFALDTTGSMQGLIDGAKRRIWSLVNFIASGQPQPKVRIGLVAYRDLGDDYVTRFYDLSDDMDEVFEHLSSFRADGGGDTPEHVAKALHDAVDRTHWTQRQNGREVVQLVYLVGDAPPHTDYDDGYNYRAIAKKAAAKGVHINAILCGDDQDAAHAFRAVAKLGGGQYSTIEQNGGVADVRTPYDRKLADLNAKLASTVVGYGHGRGAAAAKRARSAAAAPMEVAADRASYAAKSGKAIFGDDDLVAGIDSLGAGGLAGAKAEELPAEMAAMKPEEREHYVAGKRAEREKVMEEIKKVSSARDAFLRADAKKSTRRDGFDDRVRKAIVDETSGVLTY